MPALWDPDPESQMSDIELHCWILGLLNCDYSYSLVLPFWD
jgi:hypothetical protein